MTDKDILECSHVVLNFIEENYDGTYPSKMQVIMNEVLVRNGWYKYPDKTNGDMIGFTKYINKKYDLGYKIEGENGDLRNFFRNHSVPFYKRIISQLTREEKLNKILNV